MNIGMIGAGAIANFLLNKVNNKKKKEMQITSVLVRDRNKYQSLEEEYGVKLFTEMDAFLDSDIDIVAEAANIEAVKELIPAIIRQKDVILISVGALADESFSTGLYEQAEKYHRTVHLPSGAIGGLDLVQNANALNAIETAQLTTRKPAHSLTDETLTEAKAVFTGKASEAIKQYPKNVNVSIVLSLAGIGMNDTKMTLIADPEVDKNIHQIEVEGEFGKATFTIENNPLPENPKTSYLAAMSVLGTLQRVSGNMRIGG